MIMQKLINVLAVTSFLVSAGVVGGGTYLYLNQDAIIESVKSKAMDEVKNLLPGIIGGGAIGGALVPEIGSSDTSISGTESFSIPSTSGFGF
tara:strand:- start:176 stop:451 length:276 start_codon:yes stop_codon:yes gene_type:complete